MTDVLLVAILLILLFGAGAVLTGLGWLAGIVVAVVLIVFFLAAMARFVAAIARFWDWMVRSIGSAWSRRGQLKRLPGYLLWGSLGLLAALTKGYLKLLAAPILIPREEWRDIQNRRRLGVPVGSLKAISDVFIHCVMSILVWLFFGIAPLAGALAAVFHGFS